MDKGQNFQNFRHHGNHPLLREWFPHHQFPREGVARCKFLDEIKLLVFFKKSQQAGNLGMGSQPLQHFRLSLKETVGVFGGGGVGTQQAQLLHHTLGIARPAKIRSQVGFAKGSGAEHLQDAIALIQQLADGNRILA